MTDLFIANARLVDPATGYDGPGALLARSGTIEAAGPEAKVGKPPKGVPAVDAGGAVLAPGLVDMRVQSRNPGFSHQESRTTLARAAAAGGVTSMVCLPNTEPVLDNPDSLAALIGHATGGAGNGDGGGPRIYAYGAATRGLEDTAMAELGLLAEAGAVGFTNGIRPIAGSLTMRRIMHYAAMLGRPVIQHAEDPALAEGGEMHEGEASTRLGLRGIPAEAEEVMIARDITLARLTGARYHVAHISTRRGLELVRRAKQDGISVTCDTAPPYFMLNDLAPMEYDTRFQLSPPLRGEDDRQAVLEALGDGTIDCVASDHAPHDRDSKLLPFGLAARGASALETLLPMVAGLDRMGICPLVRALALASAAPAALLGLPGGTLAPGAPADLVLFDPDRGWRIRGEEFESLSAATPFEGHPTQGAVVATWVGGVMVHGKGMGGRPAR